LKEESENDRGWKKEKEGRRMDNETLEYRMFRCGTENDEILGCRM